MRRSRWSTEGNVSALTMSKDEERRCKAGGGDARSYAHITSKENTLRKPHRNLPAWERGAVGLSSFTSQCTCFFCSVINCHVRRKKQTSLTHPGASFRAQMRSTRVRDSRNGSFPAFRGHFEHQNEILRLGNATGSARLLQERPKPNSE